MPPERIRFLVAPLAAIAVLITLAACGSSDATSTITESRTVADDGSASREHGMNTSERLGVQNPLASGNLPEGHPPIGDDSGGMMGTSPPPSSGGLSWSAPESWRKEGPRSMRVVSFKVGPDDATECYVTVLGGAGGGMAANINRWRGQMGQPPLSPEAIDELPKIEILGQQAPLVEIGGHFTGMGDASQSDAALLGTVCELAGRAVFVKLVGAAATVATERENFIAFCKSLK